MRSPHLGSFPDHDMALQSLTPDIDNLVILACLASLDQLDELVVVDVGYRSHFSCEVGAQGGHRPKQADGAGEEAENSVERWVDR